MNKDQPMNDQPRLSLRQRLAHLAVGESVSEAKRIGLDDPVLDITEKMRNVISPAVMRAKRDTDATYVIENTTFLNRAADALLITFVITRTA